MPKVKILIIGESDYSIKRPLDDLPKCKNDIKVMKMAFVTGLCIPEENISIRENLDSKAELFSAIDNSTKDIMDDDIFILYFTGHGGKNHLCLCKENIKYEEIVKQIRVNNVKTAVFMMDCCHSGSFFVNSNINSNIDNWFDNFAEKGYALFASCGSTETCGFKYAVSAYTYLLSEALMIVPNMNNGEISLEKINQAITVIYKNQHIKNTRPIYKSNVIGTIHLCMHEKEVKSIQKEQICLDSCIIYSIEDTKVNGIIRRTIHVISKKGLNKTNIESMFLNDIQNVLNKGNYRLLTNNPNIVFCYFGECEQDMLHCNFGAHVVWADAKYQLCQNETFSIFNHKYFQSYKNDRVMSDEETRLSLDESVNSITQLAEEYLLEYRKYCNKEIELTEEEFISSMSKINNKIDKFEANYNYSKLVSPALDEYAKEVDNLVNTVSQFKYVYNNQYVNYRDSQSKWMEMNRIKKCYQKNVSNIKRIRKNLDK